MADQGLARYRAAVAVELRMAGAEYEAIARELGFAGKSGAWKAVQRALRLRAMESSEAYRNIALADLDMLLEKNWRAAMSGNLEAIDRCLRATDQRSRLLGLY